MSISDEPRIIFKTSNVGWTWSNGESALTPLQRERVKWKRLIEMIAHWTVFDLNGYDDAKFALWQWLHAFGEIGNGMWFFRNRCLGVPYKEQPVALEDVLWEFLPMKGDLCQWCYHVDDCPMVPVFGVWKCTLQNKPLDSRPVHTRMKTFQEMAEEISGGLPAWPGDKS